MEAHNKQSPYDVNLLQTRPTPEIYAPAKHFTYDTKFTLQDINRQIFQFCFTTSTGRISISTHIGVVAHLYPHQLKWSATKKNGKLYLSLKWDDQPHFFSQFREADNGQKIDQYKLFVGIATRKREFDKPKSEEPPHWAMMRHLEL